ncbi:MAG TPA: discoidin domain-containing protein, partial [Vicinamibacterales bacterium]|nr:discoidin domain-containing protein [Vicinamibacterales bacterium]
ARIEVSCGPWALASMTDGDLISRWDCGLPQDGREEVRIRLGRLATVGAVVGDLGPWASNFPRQLVVETSIDGTVWQPGWDGDVLELMFAATFADPKHARLVVPLAPRAARYIRLRQTGTDPAFYWSIAELEIWSDSTRTNLVPRETASRSSLFRGSPIHPEWIGASRGSRRPPPASTGWPSHHE